MDQAYLEPFHFVSIVTSTMLGGGSTQSLEITAPFSFGWLLQLFRFTFFLTRGPDIAKIVISPPMHL